MRSCWPAQWRAAFLTEGNVNVKHRRNIVEVCASLSSAFTACVSYVYNAAGDCQLARDVESCHSCRDCVHKLYDDDTALSI